jgi:hypothetical protein
MDAVEGPSLATNATNHFLYNLFQWALVHALPFVSPVLLLTLVSVVFGMLALRQVERLAREFSQNEIASLMAVLTFGVSFSWWQQVETMEVYSFNAFLFTGFALHAVRVIRNQRASDLRWAGIYLSLALITHIQNILCLPFFLWMVLRQPMPIRQRAIALLPLPLAVAVLLFPPLLLDAHPVSAIFFDTQFKKDVMGFDPKVLGMGVVKGIAFFGYNFHFWLIPMIAGFVGLLRRDRRMGLWLCLLLLPFLAFAVKYSVSDNHVFYLSVYAVLVAVSATAWEKFLQRRPRWAIPLMAMALLTSPALYLGTTAVVRQLPQGQALETEKAYKGGVAHYTWPGRKSAPDPIEAARHLQPGDSVEWNSAPALEYVEWQQTH